MKTLSDSSFFRTFDLLVGASNPPRSSITGPSTMYASSGNGTRFGGRTHCFAIDVFALSRVGRRHWSLVVVKEFWWDGGHKRSIKTQGWSKLVEGSRRDVIAWLRGQEQQLERKA